MRADPPDPTVPVPQDDDGDDVNIPPLVIKIKPFDFVPYSERKDRNATSWLDEHAAKKQRA